LNLLRDELVAQIKGKERILLAQTTEVLNRLQAKEEDLSKVKSIFVEKLKDLETSFVEISHEVDSVEQHHL
jgi:hypothetical protein